MIQRMIRNPDAFLIAPCSYTHTTEAVQEAINAGIKVILVDSVIDKEIANGVVATDNFKAGKELGTFGSSTATEREDGIREGNIRSCKRFLGTNEYIVKKMGRRKDPAFGDRDPETGSDIVTMKARWNIIWMELIKKNMKKRRAKKVKKD